MDLEDAYSKSLDLKFTDENGKKIYPHVGSYAIGIERALYTIVHQNRKSIDGITTITWPPYTAPFDIGLIGIGENGYDKRVYKTLITNSVRTLHDDTKDSIGVKIHRLYALGVPYIVFAGEQEEMKDVVGIEDTRTSQRFETNIENILKQLECGVIE